MRYIYLHVNLNQCRANKMKAAAGCFDPFLRTSRLCDGQGSLSSDTIDNFISNDIPAVVTL